MLENFENGEIPYPVLKVNQYPIPKKMIQQLYNSVEKVLVLEDGYPIIEELLRGYLNIDKKVMGRMDGSINRTGELNPNIVAGALGI